MECAHGKERFAERGRGERDEMIRQPKNRAPTHPGVHLRKAISRRGFTREEAADAIGISYRHLSAIMNGHQAITPHIALRLEKTLGVSTGFWLNSQLARDRWRAT